jgi:hypothetical protein
MSNYFTTENLRDDRSFKPIFVLSVIASAAFVGITIFVSIHSKIVVSPIANISYEFISKADLTDNHIMTSSEFVALVKNNQSDKIPSGTKFKGYATNLATICQLRKEDLPKDTNFLIAKANYGQIIGFARENASNCKSAASLGPNESVLVMSGVPITGADSREVTVTLQDMIVK